MNFRHIACLLLVIALRCTSLVAAEPKRPNILWLIAEDIGPDMACYGDPDARTPRIDRLAGQGTLYRNAYSTAPVCSASRSAFCTGMYQTSLGAHHHRSHRDDGFRLPSGVRLITDRLREAGYFTANIRELPPELNFRGAGKTDWNFEPEGKPFDSARWADLKSHQPFYAQVNFTQTHRVYHKSKTEPHDPARVHLPAYLADDPVTREDWALYHDSISQLDAQVGAVLDLLQREGLAADTLVFFFGDNGRECFRGKYFAYEQGCHVPLIVRWPEHLAPGKTKDQLVSLIDVTTTTLEAAGLSLPDGIAGVPLWGPQAQEREFIFTARDRIDDTLDRVRTVRDARFKYIRNFQPERPYLQPMAYAEHTNPNYLRMQALFAEGKLDARQQKFLASHRPSEELYDLSKDPLEFDNLADDPKRAGELKRLRAALDRWIDETHDQGATPEDPEALRKILDDHDRKMEQQFGTKAKS